MKKRLTSTKPKKFTDMRGSGYSKLALVGLSTRWETEHDKINMASMRSWWMISSPVVGFRPTWKVK